MRRLARLGLTAALLALTVPSVAGAEGQAAGASAERSLEARSSKLDRGPKGPKGDRGRVAACQRALSKQHKRDRKAFEQARPKPTKAQRDAFRRQQQQERKECHDDDDDGGGGVAGGDRAFGDGTTQGLSFRFDASSGPNGENPNPTGSETGFVQFTDSTGETFAGPVRCLTVVGNQAVIGFDNQNPSSEDIDVFLFVEDNAGAGPDRLDAEATFSPDLCPAPRTPDSEVTSGDVTVQDNTAGGGGGGGGHEDEDDEGEEDEEGKEEDSEDDDSDEEDEDGDSDEDDHDEDEDEDSEEESDEDSDDEDSDDEESDEDDDD